MYLYILYDNLYRFLSLFLYSILSNFGQKYLGRHKEYSGIFVRQKFIWNLTSLILFSGFGGRLFLLSRETGDYPLFIIRNWCIVQSALWGFCTDYCLWAWEKAVPEFLKSNWEMESWWVANTVLLSVPSATPEESQGSTKWRA